VYVHACVCASVCIDVYVYPRVSAAIPRCKHVCPFAMPPPLTPGRVSPGGSAGGMWNDKTQSSGMPTPPTSGVMCGIGCNININADGDLWWEGSKVRSVVILQNGFGIELTFEKFP